MCVMNKMIVALSSMEQNEEVSLRDLYEQLTGRTYDIWELVEELDLDYIQVINIFDPLGFNQYVRRNPDVLTVANSLAMLSIFKMTGVSSWQKAVEWDVDADAWFDNVNDLMNEIQVAKQKRTMKTKVLDMLTKKGIDLSKFGLVIKDV